MFRAAFIAAGSVLIASFAWIQYVFGALLVATGIKMAVHRNETIHPAPPLRLLLAPPSGARPPRLLNSSSVQGIWIGNGCSKSMPLVSPGNHSAATR
ncbi:TerC family protein [Nocardia cyriacigeorgica]|uniref:TerC family protein n=1 Tax=Nocardia cyriacigeorgica TaxID=135487 RepID=UPI003CC7E597